MAKKLITITDGTRSLDVCGDVYIPKGCRDEIPVHTTQQVTAEAFDRVEETIGLGNRPSLGYSIGGQTSASAGKTGFGRGRMATIEWVGAKKEASDE